MNSVQKALKELRDKELVVGEVKKVPTGLVTLKDAEDIIENLEIKILNERDGITTKSGYRKIAEVSFGKGELVNMAGTETTGV